MRILIMLPDNGYVQQIFRAEVRGMAKKHIRRYQDNGIVYMERESGSDMDFPVHEIVSGYAGNLLSFYDINDNFMEFFFYIMDRTEQKALVDMVYERLEREEEVSPAGLRPVSRGDAYESIGDNRSLASEVNRDVNRCRRWRPGELRKCFSKVFESRCRERQGRACTGFQQRLNEIRELFYLDADDIELLVFLFCMYEINLACLNSLADSMNFQEFLKFTSIALDMPYARVREKLSSTGSLYECGIIDDINTGRNDFYSLDSVISGYLFGLSDSSLVDIYVKRDREDVLDCGSFSIDEESRGIISSLITAPGPCNILLYGSAGTGKTEFARSIVRECGRHACFLQYGENDLERGSRKGINNSRLMALRIGARTVDPEQGVLIVDEADAIINTRYMFFSVQNTAEKGWLNSFLEGSPAKIIWISNESKYMEESTLRRFSYSRQFEPFTVAQRKQVFMNRLQGHPLARFFTEENVTELCARYRINAGGIASTLESLKLVFKNERPTKKAVESRTRNLLERHMKLVSGGKEKTGPALADLTGKYDPEAINTDIDSSIILPGLKNFCDGKEDFHAGPGENVNILFWGEPGTGKTEYAKYLAKSLSRRLLVRRYSDLESMWVGMTEKNIRNAFREAEGLGALLFIDEADSFFTSRESAYRSWEVSRTNEFLTQMENHGGIFICCTNLLPNMDRAAMRRFTWKVEFRPLKPEYRVALYRKYFTIRGKRLSPAMAKRVRGIEGLTPGDLNTVWRRFRFIPDDEMRHEGIISALESEAGYRSQNSVSSIGF